MGLHFKDKNGNLALESVAENRGACLVSGFCNRLHERGQILNPTIYDVSRLSGVSTATVSRAFSDPEKVRESTRRKVFEAAEVLHYLSSVYIKRALS